MGLKSFGLLGRVVVVFLASSLLLASSHASAIDRKGGESWTYQMYTSLEIEGYVVDLFGNVTYEFKNRDSLVVNSIESDVNVIDVDGKLSGTLYIFGDPAISMTVEIAGTLYETQEGVGTAKEDVHWLISVSVGSGPSSWLVQQDTQIVTSFSPAFMSEFDADATDHDAQWSESMVVNVTTTTWENGTQVDTSTDKSIMEFEFSVEPIADSIITPAGTYEADRITVTDEDGDREVLWWSDDVGNLVKTLSYYAGDDEAYESMVLASYEKKPDSNSTLLIVVVGLVFAVAAAIVLAVVLLRMRK